MGACGSTEEQQQQHERDAAAVHSSPELGLEVLVSDSGEQFKATVKSLESCTLLNRLIAAECEIDGELELSKHTKWLSTECYADRIQTEFSGLALKQEHTWASIGASEVVAW